MVGAAPARDESTGAGTESGAKAAEGGIHLLDKAHEGEVLEVALGDFKKALVDEEEIAPFVAQQSFGHDVVPWHGRWVENSRLGCGVQGT